MRSLCETLMLWMTPGKGYVWNITKKKRRKTLERFHYSERELIIYRQHPNV